MKKYTLENPRWNKVFDSACSENTDCCWGYAVCIEVKKQTQENYFTVKDLCRGYEVYVVLMMIQYLFETIFITSLPAIPASVADSYFHPGSGYNFAVRC